MKVESCFYLGSAVSNSARQKLNIMESKILIDITPMGKPFIYIDYKASDDLRDKVLGRFLGEARAFDLDSKNPIKMELHVLWYDQQTQRAQAMIEYSSEVTEKDTTPEMIYAEALEMVDAACVEKLPHDIYKKWKDIMFDIPKKSLRETSMHA